MNNMAAKLRARRANARSRKALNRAVNTAADSSMRNELTWLAWSRNMPTR